MLWGIIALIAMLGGAGLWIWYQSGKLSRKDAELKEKRRLAIVQARLLAEIPKIIGVTDAKIEEVAIKASTTRTADELNELYESLLRDAEGSNTGPLDNSEV
jgi:hypothetical protein